MSEQGQVTGDSTTKKPNANGLSEEGKTVWYTEGCIKELKFDGKSVTLQVEPTEAFSTGVDGAKKILFVKEEETGAKPVDAKLVEDKTSFALGKGTDGEDTKISPTLLYQIKKDHVRIRMVVGNGENFESVSQIKSITII